MLQQSIVHVQFVGTVDSDVWTRPELVVSLQDDEQPLVFPAGHGAYRKVSGSIHSAADA